MQTYDHDWIQTRSQRTFVYSVTKTMAHSQQKFEDLNAYLNVADLDSYKICVMKMTNF